MKKLFDSIFGIPPFAIFNLKLNLATIPSFIFHKVKSEEFESLLFYLKNNNYRTLNIKEYYDYLIGKRNDNDKKVILTFDDGLRNNWSVVFPLLKKFDMKAVFYVNPGRVSSDNICHRNLEDVWAKRATEDDLSHIEEKVQFITWEEARVMQYSGLVDIESHGWIHQICFVSEKIIDFQHPDKEKKPAYPWLFSAFDMRPEEATWGAPVYSYEPRLVALRFFDDVGLRMRCINYVQEHGGIDFFSQNSWRRQLKAVATKYVKNHTLLMRRENEIEQELAIRYSLVNSKKKIEKELDKPCLHFAYPWSRSEELSLLWLKELGFRTVFRFMNPYRIPQTGSDPYNLSRIEGYWIRSLPGKNRVSIWDKLVNRIFR